VTTSSGDQVQPKVSTDHVALDPASGMTKTTDKQVDPASISWQKPTTVVQATGPQAKGAGEKAVVTFVEDGDTAYLKKGDGSKVTCRIDGIDAPETGHPKVGKPGQKYGEEAGKLLRDMIDQKEVTLRITKPAQEGQNFGRSTCQIEISGKDVSKEMVRAGAAWLYRRYATDPAAVNEMAGLEADARANKRGLWADPNPMNPEQFRRILRNSGKGNSQ
jgi:micrococcal nuclease